MGGRGLRGCSAQCKGGRPSEVALGPRSTSRAGDRAAARGHGWGPGAGTPFIVGAKAPYRCRLFFGAPQHGAAGVWDARERAGLQPATDFTTPGVPREGEEGSRQRVRIPSPGLPVIPLPARESLG